MNIRYRVNAYDEQRLFNGNLDLDTDTVAHGSHVRLGSLDNIIHLSSYAIKLRKDIHLQDLQNLLTKFLRLNRVLGVGDSGVSGLRVCVLPARLLLRAHTRTGGSLSCIAGYVRLPGDGNKENRPPPCHNLLAQIRGTI